MENLLSTKKEQQEVVALVGECLRQKPPARLNITALGILQAINDGKPEDEILIYLTDMAGDNSRAMVQMLGGKLLQQVLAVCPEKK